MQRVEKGKKAAALVIVSTLIISILKAAIGKLSGSVILFADAVHGALDIISVSASWFGLKISERDPDQDFPYGYYKAESPSYSPSINVYSAEPANSANIVPGDYNSLGTVAYCDTPITYGDFDLSGYNEFVLNEVGIEAINKAGVTNFGWRDVVGDVRDIVVQGVGRYRHMRGPVDRFGLVVGASLNVRGLVPRESHSPHVPADHPGEHSRTVGVRDLADLPGLALVRTLVNELAA